MAAPWGAWQSTTGSRGALRGALELEETELGPATAGTLRMLCRAAGTFP